LNDGEKSLEIEICPEQTSWIQLSAPLDLLLSIYLLPYIL
jgi:hypothetical protein